MARKKTPQSTRQGWPPLLIAFGLWLVAFLACVTVPAKPFQDVVVNTCFSITAPADSSTATAPWWASFDQTPTKHVTPPKLCGWWILLLPLYVLIIAVSYPPCNLVFLCCFGALLGAYARRTFVLPHEPAPREPRATGYVLPGMTAMIHGFCVYLGLVAGFIIIQGGLDFTTAGPDDFLRIAAFATLTSILAGANDHFLRDLAKAFRIVFRPNEAA